MVFFTECTHRKMVTLGTKKNQPEVVEIDCMHILHSLFDFALLRLSSVQIANQDLVKHVSWM